jgi:ABC-type sugar transport system, ATPase component
MVETAPIVEMRKINKAFPGVQALSGVDFRLFKGEVHAIMGQNGAGKSTLVKVMTGVYRPESGDMLLEGKPLRPDSPIVAQRLGINTVYQEVNLCLNLSVAENIFIGKEPKRFGRIDWKKMNADAAERLARLNIKIDVSRELSTYPIAIQQMAAIARVLDSSVKVLILDEPTSSLDEDEVEQLFSVIRKLRDEGLAILFITHFLDQTYHIADRITVLKNGTFVGEYMTSRLPKLELVAKMIGREVSETGRSSPATLSTKDAAQGRETIDSILSVKRLGRHGSIAPFDLSLCEGDVLGLAGLLGSGRTEMARLLFGIDKAEGGEVSIEGKKRNILSPKHAMIYGMGYCSEDRKNEGIFAELSIRENIILALQAKMGAFKSLSMKRQLEIAEAMIKRLGIKTPSANSEAGQLSGGNQQKVMLARWLATDPKILILDEPTRGIDVGAKVEIMDQVLDLAKTGIGVIFISSEFEEILRCSNKIAVLKDKAKIAELVGEDMTESTIMHTIAGGR